MSGWSARGTDIDPGLVTLALRGIRANGSGWRYPFVAEAKRRRRRWAQFWDTLAFLLLLAGVLGALYWFGFGLP